MDFSDPKLWKPKRLIVCNNLMPLWIGLQGLRIHHKNRLTRQELKEIIKSYPKDTDNCKCRNCRYHRIIKRLENKSILW